MSSGMDQCTRCGGKDIDRDEQRGEVTCQTCGQVLEQSIIVNEAQFAKGDDGSAELLGCFVDNSAAAGVNRDVGRITGYRNHRLITERKCHGEIERVCYHLKCKSIESQAKRYLNLALTNKLSRGRKMAYVIGACLYLACRSQNLPFMLIDFADALEVDIFYLGSAYQKLCDCLKAPKHLIDPSVYINRFANKLDFGTHTHEVAEMAIRLVKRMGRDWLDRGRRPTGLCGAALFIAAKSHDFQIQFKDIERVAKIGHTTIRKRLEEFECTDSASLSIDKFNKKGDDIEDYGKAADPPSYRYSKSRSQKIQKRIDAWVEMTTQHVSVNKQQVNALADMLDKSLDKESSRKNRTTTSQVSSPAPSICTISDTQAINTLLADTTLPPDKIAEIFIAGQFGGESNHLTPDGRIDMTKCDHLRPSLEDYGVEATIDEQFANPPTLEVKKKKSPVRSRRRSQQQRSGEQNANATTLADELNATRPSTRDCTPMGSTADGSEAASDVRVKPEFVEPLEEPNFPPEVTRPPSHPDFKQHLSTPTTHWSPSGSRAPVPLAVRPKPEFQVPEKKPRFSETFSDVDDEDIDQYILPASDVLVKSAIWERENGQVYREKMAKAREREEEEARKMREAEMLMQSGIKVKRKKTGLNKQNHSTTINAMAKVVQSKRLSSKVNFEVLKELGKVTSCAVPSAAATPATNMRPSTSSMAPQSLSAQSIARATAVASAKAWTPATPATYAQNNPQGGYLSTDESSTEDDGDDIFKKYRQNDDDSD